MSEIGKMTAEAARQRAEKGCTHPVSEACFNGAKAVNRHAKLQGILNEIADTEKEITASQVRLRDLRTFARELRRSV